MRGWARAALFVVVAAFAVMVFSGARASAVVDVSGWHTVFNTSVEGYAPPSMGPGKVVWADADPNGGSELKLHDIAEGSTSLLLTTNFRIDFPRLDGDHIVFQGYGLVGDRPDSAVYLYTLSSGKLRRLSAPDSGAESFRFSGDVVAWMQMKATPAGAVYRQILLYRISTDETRTLTETVPGADYIYISLVSDNWVLWRTYHSQAGSNLVAYSVTTGAGYVFEELRFVSPELLEGDILHYTRSAGAVWELRARDLSNGNDSLILENSQPIQSVSVDVERVAFASWDSGGSYAAILDRTTGRITRIYSPAYQVGGLALRGSFLYWRGERSFFANSPGAYLFAYDTSDGTATRLSHIQSYASRLDTDGQAVAVHESHYGPDYFASELSVMIKQAASAQGVFPDVAGTHPYRTAIKGLGEAGAVGGFPAGNGTAVFRPDASLTRGQFAKILVEALDTPELGDHLSTLVELGILQGDAQGRLNPYDPLTRAQLISLIVRAADKLKPELLAGPVHDRPSTLGLFDTVHSLNLRRAEWGGLLDGLVGFSKTWNPWQTATRGEAAQVLWNLASWQK